MSESNEGRGGRGYTLDRHWHLAGDDKEMALTEIEHTLFRVMAAFERWQSECLAAVTHRPLSGSDNAVLHIVRMKERPKTVAEIARLLNRDDISNIQYALKKLRSAGLVEKQESRKRRGVAYYVTELGHEVTERFAELRRDMLVRMIPSEENWRDQYEMTHRLLNQLQGIYDQAAVYVVSHRAPVDDEDGL
ncbi:MAG: winged helix DNA-binding protein [Arhodomonas sp.]|nr:winged helix DNA-binding protein [Arhodomonas sp.]